MINNEKSVIQERIYICLWIYRSIIVYMDCDYIPKYVHSVYLKYVVFLTDEWPRTALSVSLLLYVF